MPLFINKKIQSALLNINEQLIFSKYAFNCFPLPLGCQTIFSTEVNQQNWKATASAKVQGPTADQVWPYIADFCNIYKIFPTNVSFCVQGSDGQPGQIRYGAGKSQSPSKANTTFVQWAREELLAINSIEKYVTYQLHENNHGLKKFTGTMQVLPNGNSGCIFKWSIETAPIVGLDYKRFLDSIHGNIEIIVGLIEKLF